MLGDLSLLCWRYFSKCIKHGSAIEGQIHSKSRKSWKTRQNWKRVFLHVLPKIIHSPFITKLARSPVGAFKWRFNWNDIGGEKDRLLRQIVANVPRPHLEAVPCIAFQIGNFGFFSQVAGLFFGRAWILKECSRETDLSPGASSSTLACPSGQSKLLLEKRNKAVSCISSSSPCCSWEALRSCCADTLHKRIHPDPLHKALPPKNLKLLHIFGPHTRAVVIFYGQFNWCIGSP